jgi:nucleotide-binding universal stress UspA family protein
MFKTILAPTDGSPLSEKATDGAIELAQLSGGKIIAISVAEPYIYPALPGGAASVDTSIHTARLRELAQGNVRKVADAAQAAHVPCETIVTQSFSPYEEIIKAAQEHGCDAIVMASHGHKGLHKLLLGSETQKVLAHSTLPVLVFR